MRRIVKSLPVSIAVAALLSVAAAGCAAAASSTSPKSAPDAHAGFAGYRWQVVAIDRAGRETPVPARYAVYLQFAPDGQFGAHEPVNYHGGLYHQTFEGFTTIDMGNTLVGYAGHDPVVLLSVRAIFAFGDGVHAKVHLTGDRLAVTVGGYVLLCQRDGRQADVAGPRPSGVSTAKQWARLRADLPGREYLARFRGNAPMPAPPEPPTLAVLDQPDTIGQVIGIAS